MTTARTTTSRSGFSMVELLMAAFIMSVALLGLAALTTFALAQGGSSRKRGTGSLIAHSILDRIQAEGALTASERLNSSTGTITTTTGWTFIDPLGMTAHTSTTAESLTFDVTGTEVAATSPLAVFTVTWQRLAADASQFSINAAQQYYIVNVSWNETNPANTAVPLKKTISVSRYVRI